MSLVFFNYFQRVNFQTLVAVSLSSGTPKILLLIAIAEGTEAELAFSPSYLPFLFSNPARVSAFGLAMIMRPQLDAPQLILIKTLLKEGLGPS